MAEADATVTDKATTDAATAETKTDATFHVEGAPEVKPEGDKTADDATKDQAKIDADKKVAEEQTDKKDAKAPEVPEKYDLKLPEGVITDPELMTEFTVWAKENKWTNDQAQKAADLHLKSIGVFAQKLQTDAQAQVKAWGEEITNDKELGGAKVQETVASAEKFLSLAATVPGVNAARLKSDLVRTGMANHPDLIRVACYIGTHVGDDNLFVPDRSSGGGPTKSDAEVLYAEHK